jgi:hypothetical protein
MARMEPPFDDGSIANVEGRGRRWRRLRWVALLSWWMIPSAYLWRLAERADAFLPYLPRYVWGPPGELWRVAPVVFVFVILAATYFVVFLSKSASPRRWVSVLGGIGAVLVTAIHLIWGTALLAG